MMPSVIGNQAELDSFDDFYYVFFTGDKFVALGKQSVISSIDGQTWTVIKNDGISSDGLVTYSNGMFMIEKSDGIYTTADFQEYSKLSSAGSRLNIVQSSIQIPKLMIDAADTDSNLKYYYDMIFGDNEIDMRTFDKKLALFINLCGVNTNLLPTSRKVLNI